MFYVRFFNRRNDQIFIYSPEGQRNWMLSYSVIFLQSSRPHCRTTGSPRQSKAFRISLIFAKGSRRGILSTTTNRTCSAARASIISKSSIWIAKNCDSYVTQSPRNNAITIAVNYVHFNEKILCVSSIYLKLESAACNL